MSIQKPPQTFSLKLLTEVRNEQKQSERNESNTTEEDWTAGQVPFVFLAVKEEDGAREEVREKRRLTCVSLGALSEARQESRNRIRVRTQEDHANKNGMKK